MLRRRWPSGRLPDTMSSPCTFLRPNLGVKNGLWSKHQAGWPAVARVLTQSAEVSLGGNAQVPLSSVMQGRQHLRRRTDLSCVVPASDPSTLVHSHHTGIPALEWIT